MSMRKQLTVEQIAKRDARRAQFKALWKQVADMPETDRLVLAAKAGIVTCEGRELSVKNQCLLAFQFPAVTVVGGFKQWLRHGRCVQKGQHGLMIWVPTGHKTTEQMPDGSTAETLEKSGFIVGTVFDISQTAELETSANRVQALELECAA
jgi:hypothetical protein